MTQSTPHLAILSSGPTGLEAALTAAESSHPFTVYKAGPQPATSVAA